MHRDWNRTWSALNCIDSAAISLHALRSCNFLCRVVNDKCNPVLTPTHANTIHALMFRLARAAMKNSARRVICRELLQSAKMYVFQLISCNLDQWMLVCVGANYRKLHKHAVFGMRIRDACHLNIALMFDFEWQIGTSASLRFLLWPPTSMYLHVYIYKYTCIPLARFSHSHMPNQRNAANGQHMALCVQFLILCMWKTCKQHIICMRSYSCTRWI